MEPKRGAFHLSRPVNNVHATHQRPLLVPELDVSDLAESREFYVDAVGFEELYQRPEEAFVYLRLGGADLTLQQADGSGRRFRNGALERPFGRGVNLQIEHPLLDLAHQRLVERNEAAASRADPEPVIDQERVDLGSVDYRR